MSLGVDCRPRMFLAPKEDPTHAGVGVVSLPIIPNKILTCISNLIELGLTIPPQKGANSEFRWKDQLRENSEEIIRTLAELSRDEFAAVLGPDGSGTASIRSRLLAAPEHLRTIAQEPGGYDHCQYVNFCHNVDLPGEAILVVNNAIKKLPEDRKLALRSGWASTEICRRLDPSRVNVDKVTLANLDRFLSDFDIRIDGGPFEEFRNLRQKYFLVDFAQRNTTISLEDGLHIWQAMGQAHTDPRLQAALLYRMSFIENDGKWVEVFDPDFNLFSHREAAASPPFPKTLDQEGGWPEVLFRTPTILKYQNNGPQIVRAVWRSIQPKDQDEAALQVVKGYDQSGLGVLPSLFGNNKVELPTDVFYVVHRVAVEYIANQLRRFDFGFFVRDKNLPEYGSAVTRCADLWRKLGLPLSSLSALKAAIYSPRPYIGDLGGSTRLIKALRDELMS